MAGSLKNIGGYGERFGNLPLPVEQSGKAAEGEIMVGRTTGHMYVRNGGKNVSKTVELEDFLNNLRLGSMNWIRNSGDFYEDLARNDWYYDELKHKGHLTFESDDATGRKFIRVRTGPLSGWRYMANRIGLYYKLNLKKDTKICISLMCRASKNINITVKIDNVSETAPCTSSQVINITTKWTKYEAILTTNGVPIDSSKIIYIKIPDGENNVDFDIMYAQMEPGDRSSEWRPSWLDYYQRLQYTDNNTRNWVTDQVNKAISNCHNYTDSEINKLNGNLQNIINQAINNCKTYTNQEISKVNTRIDNEVDELIHRDMIQRVHLNLGNQDYTKYLKGIDGFQKTSSNVYYSEDDRGVVIKGDVKIALDLPIPIVEDSKYYMRVVISAKNKDSVYYAGADTLNADGDTIKTDTQNNYNYAIFSNKRCSTGNTVEGFNIFSGYNTPSTGSDNTKFDPYGKYFRLVIYANYMCSADTESVIKSIEIFEIPKALWNALDPGPRNRDGLMSVADKTKLDGIEERANRYIHPATDGNLHVPATGTTNNNKVLTAGSTPGSLRWVLPSTDSHTLDGYGIERFLREVPCPDHKDLNQFMEKNAFFYFDTGTHPIKNTPYGDIPNSDHSTVVGMVINRYLSINTRGMIRLQQEFINLYHSNGTRWIRTRVDNSWRPWYKVYTTADRPTPAEVGAVNKTGDSMTGELTMSNDNTGITFHDGARIYKKSGSGLTIKAHNNDHGVNIVSNTETSMLKVTTTETTASGNLKGKNLDLGRYSIKYNSDTGSLDFIFE